MVGHSDRGAAFLTMQSIDHLDAGIIQRGLAARGETVHVEVLQRCASTNGVLLLREPAEGPVLLLADEQTAGRGRRGRRWHACPGAAIMFSLRWEFDAGSAQLGGLSLAVGVSIAKTLHGLGARDVGLKWPNDLLASMAKGGAKLGGILIETRSSASRMAAVVGVGLNFRRMPGLDIRLKRRIASLDESIDPLPARNEVAIALAADLVPRLRLFSTAGFQPFKAQWEALHSNQGEPMRIRTSHGRIIAGIADGVAADGALLLRTRGGVRSVHSGTVVRTAPPRGAAA